MTTTCLMIAGFGLPCFLLSLRIVEDEKEMPA